jgi:hypothetical protein
MAIIPKTPLKKRERWGQHSLSDNGTGPAPQKLGAANTASGREANYAITCIVLGRKSRRASSTGILENARRISR